MDLIFIHRLEQGVLPLGPILVLGLTVLGILVVFLHLVVRIAGIGRVCTHLHLVVIHHLSALCLQPRLAHGGDEDAAGASPFLGCI